MPQAPSWRQGSQETEELRHAKTRDIAEQISYDVSTSFSLQAYAWMRRTLAIRADDHAEEAARPDNMPMLLIGILW